MCLDERTLAQDEMGRTGGDFLYWAAGVMAAVGLALTAWPFIDSLNASADAHRSVVWIDINTIPAGQRKTVYWGSVPVYVFHRTAEEIEAARADEHAQMPLPENNRDRVLRDEWRVVIGVNGRGCPLRGQRPGEGRGEWGGWIDSCDGLVYDLSGRVRTWWGRANLTISPYHFFQDRWLTIGAEG